MNEPSFLGLLQNVALLLALVLVFDIVEQRLPHGQATFRQIPIGLLIGAIGAGIMLTPWVLTPGAIFDTRSVLLSISGLFFGTLPTLIAMLITAALRIYQGGVGALTGVLVILATGTIGLAWRHLRKQPLENADWKEFYLFGLITHLVMLALMLTFPWEIAQRVLANISLPVLVMYPFGTVLLGMLMANRLRRERITEALRENDAALQKSESKYRLLTENIKDVVWILDTETMYFRYVSPSVERLRGYTPEEILAKPVTHALTAEASAYLINLIRSRVEDFLAGREPADKYYTNEVEQSCKDGSTVWTEVVTSYYVNPENNRVEVRGVTRDITERKRAEDALRESEGKYRRLFENTSLGVFQSTPEGKAVSVNLAFARMFGYDSPADALNSLKNVAVDAFVDPNRRTEIIRLMAENPGLRTFENLYRRKDGSTFIGILNPMRVVDAHGGLIRIEGLIEDITERKQAEEELRQSEELLHVILVNILDPVFITNNDGKFIFICPNVTSALGYPMEKIQAMGNISKLIGSGLFNPEELEVRGEITNIERLIVDNYGKQRVFLITVKQVSIREGTRLYSLHDITERKQAEDALRESEDKFKYVFDHSVIGKSITLASGELNVNQSFCEMLGYSRAELQSRKWQEITHPDDVELTQNEIKQLLSGEKESVHFTKRYIHKNGSTVWAEIGAGLRRDKEGQPLYFLTAINDITARKQAEQILRDTTEHLAHMLANSPTVIYALKVEGGRANPIWISANIETVLGFSMEDGVKPEWWPGQIHPEDRPEALAALEHLFDDFYQHEYRFLRKDGRLIWLHDEHRLLRNSDNQPWEIIGAWTDITERKQAEEALNESKLLLHLLIESLPQNIYAKDVDGRFIFANQRYCAIQGKALEEIVGKTDFELHPPELAEKYRADDRRVMETGKAIELEEEHQPIGEKKFFVQVIKAPFYDFKGQVAGTLGIFWDITERKRAEEALYEQQQVFRALVENSPDIIARYDRDCRRTYVNPEYLKVAQISPQELLATSPKQRSPLPEASAVVLQNLLRKVLESGVGDGVDVIWPKADNIDYWYNIYASPEFDREGRVVSVMTVSRDITERKRAEEEIRQLNAELEQRVDERTRELREAQEKLVRQEKLAVLGQLAGGVGHELRNPLGIINNAIYYLRLVQPDAQAKVKEYLGIIETETHNADKIISDLLDFSRIKSVDVEPVAVSDLVRGALERFPAPKNVHVTLDLPEDLPPICVDPRQVTQVLGNLVLNACQAMPKGGELRVSSEQGTESREQGVESREQRVESRDQAAKTDPLISTPLISTPLISNPLISSPLVSSNWVLITITDTGAGVTPENMKKLFEPLFTTKPKGIGLGLAVSRKLVEANGGRIEVESEPGKGTTFTVYLPVK